MNLSGRVAMLLVVLAPCLPSYGEILVYKLSQTETDFHEVGQGQWEVERKKLKSYLVIDIDYTDDVFVQAAFIDYGKDAGGKWFEVGLLEGFELVRVTTGAGVTWAMVQKDVEIDGDDIGDSWFTLVTGVARARNVGTGTNREVANKLSGYAIGDEGDVGNRELDMTAASLTLYPAWTYWANGANQGNQDFDATVDMIAGYLAGKGYTEEID